MRTFRGLTAIRTGTTVAAIATVILAGVFTLFRAEPTTPPTALDPPPSPPAALTHADTHPRQVAILGETFPGGAVGDKGAGEVPLDYPGPAVASAVYNATGCWIPELPITPEKILESSGREK